MRKHILLALTVVLPLFLSAQSALVRGPYLNLGTPESMVVRWRTTVAEVGEIRYGATPNTLDQVVTEASATTEHEIKVTGLAPATVYHYSIGTGGNAYTANDGNYFFKTSPVAGSQGPFRVWALGDFGNGSQAQRDVRDSYLENFTDVHTDAWIWLGDNAYSDGTDQEYQEKVYEVYPDAFRNIVVWPAPGNHDYGSIDLSGNGPYYDMFTLPTEGEAGGVASGTEDYYSYDYGNMHFLSLNTENLLHIALGGTAFQQWLEADLQANTKTWVIAYWHQPPYTKGTHDSDDAFSRPQLMRQNVLPLLEEYGVDLVLSGHSHGYERSYLIENHFGTSSTWNASTMLVNGTNGNDADGNAYIKYTEGADPNRGTVYAVVGSGGQKGSGDSELNHPVMYMSTEDYHGSMVIDVDGLELTARFIDTTGTALDEFTIRKSASTSVADMHHDRGIYMNAFPNPFRDSFTITFRLQKEEKVELTVSDVSGKVIQQFASKSYPAGEHQLNCSPRTAVPNGIYMVEMRTSDNLSAKRLLRME